MGELPNCVYSGTIIGPRDIGGELSAECPVCGAIFKPRHQERGGKTIGYIYPAHAAASRLLRPARFYACIDGVWQMVRRDREQGPHEPLSELAELRQDNERLRMQLAAVRGTVIGAIANGHMDNLLSLAADLGIKVGARVVDAKGDDSEMSF